MPRFSAVRTVAALAALKAAAAPAQTIIYVDDDAPPGGDGHSWPTAFADLTDALAAAAAGAQAAEVRIAQGTYTPDQGTGDRARSFEVRAPSVASGMTVWLRGGFAGVKGNDPNKIDFVKYATVLSGDLNGDDKPGFVNREDNSRRVVDVDINVGWNPSIQLEGLTIRGGWGDAPDSFGAGMAVHFDAGDVFVRGSMLSHCRFVDNSAAAGGGLFLQSSEYLFQDCEFSDNRAFNGAGGGLYVDTGAQVEVNASVLTRNHAKWGGGAYSSDATSLTLGHCVLTANTADLAGGAAYLLGWATLGTCQVTGNEASAGDGGAFLACAGLLVKKTVLSNNSAPAGRGGAIHALQWLALDASMLAANSSGGDGGAVCAGSYLVVESSVLTANTAGGDGGALACLGEAAEVTNATISANSAHRGSGVAVIGCPDAVVTDTLFWGNDSPSAFILGPNAFAGFSRCDVEGGQGDISVVDGGIVYAPTNFSADPLFADPDGPDNNPATWADNDFRLSPGSPCIEAGSTSWDQQYDTDAAGLPRLVNADCDCIYATDIGAFEFQDTNCPPSTPRQYVDADAAPGGDGRSWATAFADLQDALRTPGANEVWVAAGVYRPDGGTMDRTRAFHMSCDASIYGGFAGFETDLSQRDPATNPTVLSGDLAGNDGPGFENNGDNSNRVVVTGYSTLTLDGFTITGGNARGSNEDWAAGLLCISGRLTLSRCQIINNTANDAAGLGAGGYATLTDCVIANNAASGNVAGTGGASLWGYEATLTGCTISGNSATSEIYSGAGGLSLSARAVNIDRCRFIDNSTSSINGWFARGGALILGYDIDQCIVANSLFLGNSASAAEVVRGGAIRFEGSWLPDHHLVNCTIVDNHASAADGGGGGVSVEFNGPILTNCILWGNSFNGDTSEDAQIDAEPDAVTVGYSRVENWTGNLGGQGNSGADPLPLDPLGPDGIPGTGDEDWRLSPGSPAIDAADNSAIPEGILTDLAGADRFVDDPATQDTGPGKAPIADIGAYEFQPPWCADCDHSGTLDTFDFLCFINSFNANDRSADCTADNSFDLFDFLCFTNAFNAGC